MSPFRRIQPSALEQNERKAMLYAAFLMSETRQQSYVTQPQGALIAYPTHQQLLLDLCNQQQSYVTQLQGALVSFPTSHQLLLDLCNNHSWLLQRASIQPGTSQRKTNRFHKFSSGTDFVRQKYTFYRFHRSPETV